MPGSAGATAVSGVRGWLRGCIFCVLWYASICAGFLMLYVPLLPLLIVHQPAFRSATDAVFAAWELYPVALLELWLGVRVVVSGDEMRAHDCALLLMNHRTRLDWSFLWAAAHHACPTHAHRLKFVLKAPIRHVPGPGWVMQMNCFMYIHRRWERDKELLARTVDYLADIGYTYQVLLFPEGTDLTDKSRARSDQFAASHHLERYQHVLHPKTTGFSFLAARMRSRDALDAVYDVSIGYPQPAPPQSELDLLRGRFPAEVHFHVTRHEAASLPRDEPALREWLSALWRRKEAALAAFSQCGRFTAAGPVAGPGVSPSCGATMPSPDYSDLSPSRPLSAPTPPPRPRPPTPRGPRAGSSALHLALAFWTALIGVALAALACLRWVRWVAIGACAIFVVMSVACEGIHHVEISLHRLKRRWNPNVAHSALKRS